jgi:hypothetical protein
VHTHTSTKVRRTGTDVRDPNLWHAQTVLATMAKGSATPKRGKKQAAQAPAPAPETAGAGEADMSMEALTVCAHPLFTLQST